MENLIVGFLTLGLGIFLIDITDIWKKAKTITLKKWLIIFFSVSAIATSFAYAMEWF